MLISKAVKNFFEIHDMETLEMMLRMNEKYNLYNGENFTWQYDPDDRHFHCINSKSEEYLCGIITEYDFPPILVDFAVMENGEYVAVCDIEFDY